MRGLPQIPRRAARWPISGAWNKADNTALAQGMPRYPQSPNESAAAALALHLSIYCAVAMAFAGGFYELMQPRRIENVGLAAYKPLPGTVVNYEAVVRRHDQPIAVAAAAEPEPAPAKVTPPPAPEAKEAKKASSEAKEERPKRPRTARSREYRDRMANYAFQPIFGGFRPWY